MVTLVVTLPDAVNVEATTPYTIYNIRVERVMDGASQSNFVLPKRFSEFQSFHDLLSETVPCLPVFPAKTWFRSVAADFIEERRAQLEGFLVDVMHRQDVLHNPHLRLFLQVQPEDLSGMQMDPSHLYPHCEQEMKANDQAIVKLVRSPDGAIFSASALADTLNRVDVHLWNFRFPWEEEDSFPKSALGFAHTYVPDESGKYVRADRIRYDCDVNGLSWDPEKRQLYIALSTGVIKTYLVPEDYKSHTFVSEFDPHKQACTAVQYCPATNSVVSASADANLSTYNLDTQTSSCLTLSAPVGSMLLESDGGRAVVGCADQGLHWIQLEGRTPQLLKSMRKASQVAEMGQGAAVFDQGKAMVTPYPAFAVDSQANRLYASGFDQKVNIWHYPTPGDEKNVDVVAPPLCADSNICSLVWIPSRNELIGGDEKGNAVVWNPDEGKVHYVYKMHDTRVTCLEWLAEENILLSASGDGSVKVWKYAQI